MTTASVLAFTDYTKPYVLHTDASGDGLGAVLYQKQEGLERVIAYASRGLSNAERNYPAHKLEFLALKWAACEKFHNYLYGSEFTARSDNNPLTYVLTLAKLDATGQRWVSHLANYRFDIEYRSGKQNVDADALSRIQWPSVNALLEARHSESAPVEMMCLSQQVVPDNEGIWLRDLVGIDWRTEQRKDPVIKRVLAETEGLEVGAFSPNEKWAYRVLQQTKDRLCLRKGVLCRKRNDEGNSI